MNGALKKLGQIYSTWNKKKYKIEREKLLDIISVSS
jgi:hypothetical protein